MRKNLYFRILKRHKQIFKIIYIILFIMLLLLPTFWLSVIIGNYSSFLISVLLLTLFIALIGNLRYLSILSPFVFLVPFYIKYINQYHIPFTEQVIGILLETHYQEAIGYIGNISYYQYAILAGWIILCVRLGYQVASSDIRWHNRTRYWVIGSGLLAISLIFLSSLFIVNYFNNIEDELNRNLEISTQAPKEFSTYEVNEYLTQVHPSYPFGIFISMYLAYQEQQKINSLTEKIKNFNFHASQIKPYENQNIVLVIGESSRRNNWQLFGYNRPTNPLLIQQRNLIPLMDMLSIKYATRTSIPMMLTQKSIETNQDTDEKQISFIKAFKEVGYRTYWLSNQQKVGEHDTTTSVYANETDKSIFMNFSSYKNIGSVDGILLPEFRKILNEPYQKKLVIIHLMGSHINYAHRYPKEFGKFLPDMNSLDKYNVDNFTSKKEFVNSYDNTILYTDWVLNNIIESLKQYPQIPSFLFYASDHGEDLMDDKCRRIGHGNISKYDFEISSFVWYADSYNTINHNKINMIEQNKARPMNHSAIFPTLLDVADINIKNKFIDRSIMINYQNYPRLVEGIDYDKDGDKLLCKE